MKNIVFVLSLFVVSCSPAAIVDEKEIYPSIPQLCENACGNAESMKCPEAEDQPPPAWNPTGETLTCEQICASTVDKFDYTCWVKSDSCEALQKCP